MASNVDDIIGGVSSAMGGSPFGAMQSSGKNSMFDADLDSYESMSDSDDYYSDEDDDLGVDYSRGASRRPEHTARRSSRHRAAAAAPAAHETAMPPIDKPRRSGGGGRRGRRTAPSALDADADPYVRNAVAHRAAAAAAAAPSSDWSDTATSRGGARKARGYNKFSRASARDAGEDGEKDGQWNPVAWTDSMMPTAKFAVMWQDSLRNFEAASRQPMSGGDMRDSTRFTIQPKWFMQTCRGNGESEYSACTDTMMRVVYCRQRDETVHPVKLRLENCFNGFPFPLCVIADNDAFNTTAVPMPEYDSNNKPCGTQLRKVCAVLPANQLVPSVDVVDLRRYMSDESVVAYMKLDIGELEEQKKIERVKGVNAGRIEQGSILLDILRDVARDKSNALHAQAADLIMQASSRESLHKHNIGDEACYWHENLDGKKLSNVFEWVKDQIDSITKIESLSFRIMPLFGDAAWTEHHRWSFHDMSSNKGFALKGTDILHRKKRSESSGDSSSIEYEQLQFNAYFTAALQFL